MTVLLIIIGIYLLAGISSAVFLILREPIILHAGFFLIWLIPCVIIAFPYFLWRYVTTKEQPGGRWI